MLLLLEVLIYIQEFYYVTTARDGATQLISTEPKALDTKNIEALIM